MAKFKILTVFGTRPEAIKLAPLVKLLAEQVEFDSRICVTGQHRDMLDQVLSLFDLQPDFDLDVMQAEQDLTDLTARILPKVRCVLTEFRPDLVLVQGDTTTAFATSLACYYQQIPVGHIEAGLRTYQPYSPFPEETNRRLTSVLARWHFAPTPQAKQHLLAENYPEQHIVVTGNTVIDALHWIQKNPPKNTALFSLEPHKKMLLVTMHRRENWGKGIEQLCHSLMALAQQGWQIIFPVHPNPQVREPVYQLLQHQANIRLTDPLPYVDFVQLMQQAFLILTDSGGIQEEATALGKPVLLLRDQTERTEAKNSGIVQRVKVEHSAIVNAVDALAKNPIKYQQMAQASTLYGDGKACERIVQFIKQIVKND